MTLPGVRPSAGYNVWIDGWLQNGILVAASLLILARGVLVRANRLGWLSVGIGVGLYAAGNIVYFAFVQYDDPLPFPSAADFPWLTSYVFLFIGLVAIIRQRVKVSDRALLLDAAVAALGLTAIASTWLSYVLHATHGAFSAVVVTMAYPVSDLVLLTIVIAALALLGLRTDRTLGYLGVGLLLFAAADTIYTLRVATNTYSAGTVLDGMWAIAAVTMAAAALRPPPRLAQPKPYSLVTLAAPSLFASASLALLIYGGFHPLPSESIVLAGLAMVAGIIRTAITFLDVRRLARTKVEARTDELTQLGNRRRLYEAARQMIKHAPAEEQIAVMLIDLDRFKEVNDSLGHSIGDEMLVQVGRRLAKHMRSDDLLVRLGGDEFAVLSPRTSGASAMALADRLRTELQPAFTVHDVSIHIDASIGVAIFPDSARTIDGLLQRADIAMYEAKNGRLGSVLYDAANEQDLGDRLRLTQGLRTAIDDGQLILHYQPKYALKSGRLNSVEALVRWNHPSRGLLYPDAFISEAERYGLMRSLTTKVLTLALDQTASWRDAGTPVAVAVNLSTSNLLDLQLPEQVRDMLASRGLPPTSLILEVTETDLMSDPLRAHATLRRLRELEIRISIDDFGTGYSSLARLRDLPVTEVKLDRSFVAELEYDEKTRAIVGSTIHLAHVLGLVVVAEGVETAEAATALEQLGCDIGQGYFFGRPVASDALDLAASRETESTSRKTSTVRAS